jgi:transposase
MRTIGNLTQQEEDQLRQVIWSDASRTTKRRCQCILYSQCGLTTSELMGIFNVDRRTIYNWINRWKKGGLAALQDKPGRGVKPKLNPRDVEQVEKVAQVLASFPKSPQRVLQQLNHQLPQPISSDTLRRFVKKTGLNAA